MRSLRALLTVAAVALFPLVACSPPPAEESATAAVGAEPVPVSAREVVEATVAAIGAAPRAFEFVERRAGETRSGRLLVASTDAADRRFVIAWEGEPPARVTSDGRTVYALGAEGDLEVSAWDRAGGVLLGRAAGKLVPGAMDPSSFAGYGAEVEPADGGLTVVRAPLPNGGGWELAVSNEDRLPRRIAFRAAPDAGPEVLELEPVAAAVPSEIAAFRLAPAPGGERREFFAGPAPGEPAPAASFQLLDGTAVALADLRGSAVVLDFWATWCIPCRPAMQELEELHREFGDQGLKVFGLRLFDAPTDPTDFLEELGVTYAIGDGAPLAEPLAVGTYGVPTLYVLDRDGTIVDLVVGFNAELSPPKIRAAVLAALG